MSIEETQVESTRKSLVDCVFTQEHGLHLEYEDRQEFIGLSVAGARQLRDWLNSIDLAAPAPQPKE